ncbi:hypothetical protein FS842_004729 [Serendipita sp. 407]|nr:hypothetical protein FS842_004729 [Serendipita sp. 407]
MLMDRMYPKAKRSNHRLRNEEPPSYRTLLTYIPEKVPDFRNATCAAVHEAMSPFIESLRINKYRMKDHLHTLVEQVGLRDPSRNIIPLLVGLLKDQDPYVRSAATIALGKLAEQETLIHDAFFDVVELLVELLEDNSSDVRSAATSVLRRLVQQVELHNKFSDAVPSLVELLGHKDYYIRSAAVDVIAKLAEKNGTP